MTGILQGCLLAMGVTFELRARKKGMSGKGGVNGMNNGHTDEINANAHEHINGEEDHEGTGLLGNER